MSITIEKATPADAAAIIAYLRQVGGETDNLSFGAEGLPVTVEAEADYIEQIRDSSDACLLVAKEREKIIGSASLSRFPRRMSHRGEISVTVLKSHWNQGIGSRLLREILVFAKENVFEILELQVRSDNRQAIHLYEKHGFETICTYPAFFKIGNQLVDFDFMLLRLK